jgi:hypothetical protein
MLVVRAGKDAFAGLNDAIDTFVAAALKRNLPLTVVNHAQAPHAFDLLDDSSETRRTIDCVVDFATDALVDRVE